MMGYLKYDTFFHASFSLANADFFNVNACDLFLKNMCGFGM